MFLTALARAVSDQKVTELTSATFDNFITTNQFALVLFYDSRQTDSQAAEILLLKLASSFENSEPKVAFGKTDVATEKGIPVKPEGGKTLSFNFFFNKQHTAYSGPINEAMLMTWLKKRTGRQSTEISTPEEIKDAERNRLACILILPPDSPHTKTTLDAFNRLSFENDLIPFYFTFNLQLRRFYNLEHRLNFVVWRDFDDFQKSLGTNEGLTFESMTDFLSDVKFPKVMEMTQEASEMVWKKRVPTMILFTRKPEGPIAKVFKEFAKDDKLALVRFGVAGLDHEFGKQLAEFFGLKASEEDTVRLVSWKSGQGRKFKLETPTKTDLGQFLENWKADKVKPYFKSSLIPRENTGAIKEVVGDSFEQEVLLADKHVVVYGFVPWSNECRAFEAIYARLARNFADNKGLVFMRMDFSQNEHPSFEMTSLPAMKLFLNGSNKSAAAHTGKWTYDEVFAFLEEKLAGSQASSDL